MDQVLRQLLVATGHAASPSAAALPPVPEVSAPPPVVPALAPTVAVEAEYPLVPSPPTFGPPIAGRVPSPRPRAPGCEPMGTPTADSLDGSLERAVQEALATLDGPAPEPVDARSEGPDVRPRTTRPSVDGLTFSCPECGAEGRARMDRLDRQLCCSRCRARVYLDANGALVVGNLDRVEPGGDTPRAAVAYQRRGANPLEFLVDGWCRISGPIGISFGVAALLTVIGLACWATSSPDLPATLEGRAKFAAEAFAHESSGRLRAITTPGTSRETGAWMNLVRPHFFRGKIRDVRIAVTVPQQDGKRATVLAHVVVPGGTGAPDPRSTAASGGTKAAASPPPGPAPVPRGPRITGDGREIDLTLFWERDKRGQWWLDGSRTFKSAVRSRFWDTSGAGAEPAPLGDRPRPDEHHGGDDPPARRKTLPGTSGRPRAVPRRGPHRQDGESPRGVRPAA
jgi:hypothetical protein